MNNKKKRKGGAEKIRLKKQKLLEASGQKCVKLTSVFKCSSSSSTSTPDAVAEVVTEVININSLSQDQELSCTGQQLHDHIEIEQENVNTHHAHTPALDSPHPSASEQQTEQDDSHLDLDVSFDYFKYPKKGQLDFFFKYHPKQDISDPVLQRAIYRKDGSKRKWLTYSEEQGALFCSVCLAFSTTPDSSSGPFLRGMKDRRHVHLRVEEHEKTETHHACAEAYFLRSNNADIDNLLFQNQMSLHRAHVRKRREILQRIIDIVKFIGKRGLSYRGDKLEAAYSLENMSVDHGNFLELVVLLSKYDINLKDHLKDCIEKSKKLHDSQNSQKGSKGRGRGSLLTFLSKSTINKIIQAIGQLIARNISTEVQAAGMFSLQVDTTQDISCKDQCSIIVRYVTDNCVNERLLAVVECSSSTGKDMFSLVDSVLKSSNIDITKCIGNSTDGAANMQGQYNGFSSWLSKESPGQIHVWCYAHVLNLVLGDTTKAVIQSASLFSLLNDVAIFLRESYPIWEQTKEDGNTKRLSTIGETRWWSKDTALKKIFGSFSNFDSALYVTVIITLATIQQNLKFKPEVRVKAIAYLESLCKYETVITAKIFLRIFELTTPLSKYLQTSGLDILKAYHMVSQTCSELKKIARDFDAIQKATDDFVSWATEEFNKFEHFDIEVQSKFPEKRLRKRKLMPGEMAQDEVISDALAAYKINVHNIIFDTVTQSMDRRFLANGQLYADFSCLDPKRFPDIRNNKLQSGELDELSRHLLKFDKTATGENLRTELKNLALHWDKLKTTELQHYKILIEGNNTEGNDEMSLENQEEEMFVACETRRTCKNCAVCCFKISHRFNLLTNAYTLIGLAFKFLLTLSLSQVACERSFSTLKNIKNRMRSTLSSDYLNSFMLMAVEKDLLMNLDCDEIIDKVAESSELLQKSLTN
jgi:hypothetical protein